MSKLIIKASINMMFTILKIPTLSIYGILLLSTAHLLIGAISLVVVLCNGKITLGLLRLGGALRLPALGRSWLLRSQGACV